MSRRRRKAAGNPQLPEALESYLDAPFGGLFGSASLARVVEALIADPRAVYRPDDLEDSAGTSKSATREALRTLVRLGLVARANGDCGDPVYTVDRTSNIFVALVLLAYAFVDDREGTDTMAAAIHVLRASAEADGTGIRTKTALVPNRGSRARTDPSEMEFSLLSSA